MSVLNFALISRRRFFLDARGLGMGNITGHSMTGSFQGWVFDGYGVGWICMFLSQIAMEGRGARTTCNATLQVE